MYGKIIMRGHNTKKAADFSKHLVAFYSKITPEIPGSLPFWVEQETFLVSLLTDHHLTK